MRPLLMISAVLGLAVVVPAAARAAPTWWFQDPNFYGDRNVGTYVALGGQPSYTWYDDDVPWATGSVVRLPEDANYLGDVLTCVACYGGGSATMHSPYFVGASGKVYFFNHMETLYLGAHGWYNGGAVIGLTGGGTCSTGYGTFCNSSSVVSTGPHFCIETANQHAYVDFPANYTPTSSCAHSDGTSGMQNVLCTGASACAQFACGSTYYWNCESDGNLHSCDSSNNPIVTSCGSGGCHGTGTCTNDVCNVPPACAAYACGTTYYWSCGADGNLHECDSNGNPTTTTCPAGCHVTGTCTNDVCNTPPPVDAGEPPADAGPVPPDAGFGLADAAGPRDGGAAADGSATEPDSGSALTVADSGADTLVTTGCGCDASGTAMQWFSLGAASLLRKRRAARRAEQGQRSNLLSPRFSRSQSDRRSSEEC